MNQAMIPLLPAIAQVLCQYLPQGFALQATWTVDPVHDQATVFCDELIAIVRSSAMNTHTRYRVALR
jgi:hypothetical protein